MSRSTIPPGPRGRFLIGNLLEFHADPLGFVTRCAREHGDVVRLGSNNYLLFHPSDIEYAFRNTPRLFGKAEKAKCSKRPESGNYASAMLASEGQDWLQKRRLIQPAFRHQHVAACGDVIVDATEEMLARWRPGETRAIDLEMTRLAVEIAGRFLCGVKLTGEEARCVMAATDLMVREPDEPTSLPLWLPTAKNLRFKRVMHRYDRAIHGLIERLRSRRAGESAYFDLIRSASSTHGCEIPEWFLRDELALMLVTGHEPTANAMVWAWYLLATHTEVGARMLAEAEEVLGARRATSADMPELRYATAVAKEAMRLYPPMWMTSREKVADCEVRIGGYEIPSGTSLGLCAWVTQRDPRFFAEPNRFRPERWLDGSLEGLPRFAYFPFGGGPRLCIGMEMGMMELVLSMVTIVRRNHLTMAPGAKVSLLPRVTLRAQGARMIVQPRSYAASRRPVLDTQAGRHAHPDGARVARSGTCNDPRHS